MTQKEAFNIVLNSLKAKIYDLNEIKDEDRDSINYEIESCKKSISVLNDIMMDLKIN